MEVKSYDYDMFCCAPEHHDFGVAGCRDCKAKVVCPVETVHLNHSSVCTLHIGDKCEERNMSGHLMVETRFAY